MRTTLVSTGARPRLHNSDGRQRHQRKRRREDILDGNKEALISAVESRCIRAIERARGGAGWFEIQQALQGILGTLFWRKRLRATKRPELIFWNKFSTGSPGNLGHSVLAEKVACDEKTGVDFLEQIFHRLSRESWALCFGGKLYVGEKTADDFWNKFSPGVTRRRVLVRRPLATLEKTG
jgi:hypothetical protein